MTRTTMHRHRQWTIGDLLDALEALPLTFDTVDGPHPKEVCFDFGQTVPGHLTAWRGSYREAALTFNDPDPDGYYGYHQTTASEFLAELQAALTPGRTYSGWKGGEYRFTRETPLWVAPWGQSSSTAVVGVRDLGYEIVIDTDWCEF